MKKLIPKQAIPNLIVGIILLLVAVYQYYCSNILIAILDLAIGILNIWAVFYKAEKENRS